MGIGGQDPSAGLGLLPVFIAIVVYGVLWYNYKERKLSKKAAIAEGEGQSFATWLTEEKEQQVVTPDVDKTSYEYRVAIHQQADQFLGTCDIPVMTNKYRPRLDLKWFDTNWGDTLIPSAAEQLIINELNKYHVEWYREISFAGLQLSTGGWGRFDFYLPDHNLIIEYNSRLHHTRPERAEVDILKAEFCSVNKINLVTWNHRDYYHIAARVEELMRELPVS